MDFYIPTYEECLQIVSQNPDMYFYPRNFLVDDYEVSIFGYRLATYNNFMLPIMDNPEINAFELKGLAFVFDDTGAVFSHHVLLHKFWELDQYPHCDYSRYKNKRIKSVMIKEDGFLISFLRLPNGKILSFTKHSFSDPVNQMANSYLENPIYNNFISYCLNNNKQPIFEFVGSQKMTVDYKEPNMILLAIRDNITGNYLDIPPLDGISVIRRLDISSLDELLQLSENQIDIEGWVVQFDDDDFLKVKTKWWIKNKIKLKK